MLLAMRAIALILGLVAGFLLAMLCCEPIYDLICPNATDKHEGGPAFFFVLVLAPTYMIIGAIVGVIVGGRFSKRG